VLQRQAQLDQLNPALTSVDIRVHFELISTKCMPILLYGLDACLLNTADKRSRYFAQSRLLMKLFKTASLDIVQECHSMFDVEPVTDFGLKTKVFHQTRRLCV